MKKQELCKKVLRAYLFPHCVSKQVVLMVRCSIILTFFLCTQVFANGYSQNAKVDVDFRATSLKKALTALEQKSDIRLLYSEKFLPNTTVSLKARNMPVLDALGSLLKGTDLKYRLFGDGLVVIISPEGMQIDDILIKGTVLDLHGNPISGVSIRVKDTNIGVSTDDKGNYVLEAPENGTLVFSYLGHITQEIPIDNQSHISVQLEETSHSLETVVITGYSTQRKKDIIGAVSVVDTEDLKATPSSNMAAQLQGRVAGVTVSSTGDPGNTAVVRIRGFSSYGNNNPLYVIDGVPTTDASRLNPADVESMQILKDASSASIYGARAANGVIVVTTKQGRRDRTGISYHGYMGVQRLPYNNVPDLLNTTELMDYLTRTTDEQYIDPIYGQHGSFSIPDYYIVSNEFRGGVSADDPRADPSHYSIADYSDVYQIFQTSMGTDWFRAMSQPAPMQSHQLDVNGGNEKSVYAVGMNYFNQQGTFKHTGFDRYSVRVNSSFTPFDFLTIGENIQLSYDNRKGESANLVGEQTAWASAYRSAPFTPVYDINGGYGGSLIGGISGIAWNPVAYLDRRKDWYNKSLRAFGNVYAEAKLVDELSLRTSFGIDAASSALKRVLRQEYERSERRVITQLTEGSTAFLNWTWTNTLNFKKTFDKHDINVLLGTEAVKNSVRGISASVNGFDLEDENFISLNTGLPNSLADIALSNPSLGNSSLFSYFARVDYTFSDKYLLNATFRRDGSSLFGTNVRFANFPSFGLGWRLSQEDFLADIGWLNDLKLRFGWGQMGSISNVPLLNQFNTFISTPRNSFYDIDGANIGSNQGFGIRSVGNENTKWETTETLNGGIDASLFHNKLTLAVDVYQKDTRDLLVPQLRNSLEPLVTFPLINLGTMRNLGVDVQLNTTGQVGPGIRYDVGVSFSKYKNELTKLNDENTVQLLPAGRLGNVLITTEGEAVSSFYGYQIDGFYNNESDVANGPTIAGEPARIGTWRYTDVNGDGDIDTEDRMILGSPHPDFQLGVNLGLAWKNFDLTGFLFWNQGNEIFNYNKFFTYMGVLGGNVASAKLYEAWTPETASTAMSPRLGVGENNGYTSFVTGNPLSFYVEDGSYLRLRTLQLGYKLPAHLVSQIGLHDIRVYAQAQNLFTVTNYSGADPDLGLVSTGQNGSPSDQTLGVDMSGFPTPRQFLFGLNFSF